MKQDIILLNFGLVQIEDSEFFRIEYCFANKKMFVDTEKRKGVLPHQIFIKKNLSKYFSIDDVFTTYELYGELVDDYKNPLNQKFKPTKIINTQSKVVINISEQKQ